MDAELVKQFFVRMGNRKTSSILTGLMTVRFKSKECVTRENCIGRGVIIFESTPKVSKHTYR